MAAVDDADTWHWHTLHHEKLFLFVGILALGDVTGATAARDCRRVVVTPCSQCAAGKQERCMGLGTCFWQLPSGVVASGGDLLLASAFRSCDLWFALVCLEWVAFRSFSGFC